VISKDCRIERFDTRVLLAPRSTLGSQTTPHHIHAVDYMTHWCESIGFAQDSSQKEHIFSSDVDFCLSAYDGDMTLHPF